MTGTNQPGTAQDFPVTLAAGTTNVAFSVAGVASAFSHLLLKAGVAPSPANYDFLAAQDGRGNEINLESPEFRLTNYVVRVSTPTNSLAHGFTVTVTTNVTNIRTVGRPATKPLVSTNQGVLSPGTWHYFRVEIPANVSGWRVLLTSTNSGPDLYIQREFAPDILTWQKRSLSLTNDDIVFAASELTPGAYFIGVFQPSGTSAYTLRTEVISFTTLTWDPGLTHLGTQVYTNNSTNAGDYYFKITTENTSLGAWRTALNVSTGEANIYLTKGTPPSVANSQFKSERTGSDGFVIAASGFNAGEDWYYVVHAEAGAQWNLVSGEPFVTDLGVVAADGSSGSGNLAVGAEGTRYFQTTLPANAVAWRLWLNGLTNLVLVKKTSLPATGSSDLSQAGQMLVVPSYLVGGQLYFVGVSGAPGANINLDSRLQSFTDIPFLTSTNLTVTGYRYTTFRVQVPSDQLAWQISVVVSNGNPNLAVRRNFIPNESNNDAYSEVASNVTDSITLVPPTLSDGTFYITVYGTNSYTCTLQSGNPEITDINFTSATLNTDTNRVGWRFFRVSSISQQLGALGWDLIVTNNAPGTRIALRRNAAPGIWSFRNPSPGVTGSYDFLSAREFLQRPGHQADVWYVGVFTTNTPLGAFTLVTRELTADPVAFDAGTAARVSVPPGKWQFFRVDVPSNVLGWDVRLTNVTSGSPQVVIRRELLPVSLLNIGFSATVTPTNWVTGNQWVAGQDWTARNFSADGSVNESGRILTMGYGRPLETGTYYIGVISPANSTNDMSYTLLTRGIGPGWAIPVQDLNYADGSVTNSGLTARDIAVYRVNVPTNTPTWKVKLTTTTGDAVLAVGKSRIPNITATVGGSVTNVLTAGRKMVSSGNEHFVQLQPYPETDLLAGDYYLLVASDGLAGTNNTRIGLGQSSFVLRSLGTMPEIDLGLLYTNFVYSGALEGGESLALHFHTDPFPATLGFELSLEDKVGNPVMISFPTEELPDPGAVSVFGVAPADPYGNEGGWGGQLAASPDLITVSDPYETETVMLKARAQGGDHPDASYTLRVRRLYAPPIAFDGGITNIVNQTNHYEFYRIDVPFDAVGWDCRLINVSTGAPQLIISRGDLALNIASIGWNPAEDNFWPFGANWIADEDWTHRELSADGVVDEDGRILAMGMGRPLEPDTYYVGVYNPNFPSPASYTLVSRGIGFGYSIPVVDLPFADGIVTNAALLPREAAYYRVVVPTNATSWQTKLTTLTGESMLLMLTNTLPNVLGGSTVTSGKRMQKSANEHLVMLPATLQTNLLPGTNYLAVVSEGVVASNNTTRIGTGTSSFVIESRGELQVIDLGEAGVTNLVHTATLEGGEVRAYQFTVPAGMTSLEAQLQNVSGRPAMVLRVGSQFPNPGAASTVSGAGSVAVEDYGNHGGYSITAALGNANTNLISIVNPTNGVYTIMVKGRATGTTFTNAGYTLVVRATSVTTVNFDGGNVVVTNQTANTWRYYLVEVPTNALGWDIRLANVTAGLPKLVVRRDILPNNLTTGPWSNPGDKTSWPTTNQWAAGPDWTRRSTSADGLVVEDNRILAVGLGRPLEPGTYYVGVINSAGAAAMSYTLVSRGIGDGMSLPIVDLNYTGGTVAGTNLLPREAAYYRVSIPSNSPGWKVKLSTTDGEAMLVVLKDQVPNVDSGRPSNEGKLMQKASDEHFVLLPAIGETTIPAGTYYLAVVSEGLNPASSTRVGTGSSDFVLTSIGDVPVTNLGTVGAVDLVSADSLEGGESRFYQFQVPLTAPAVEMRLENRVGHPVMVVLSNSLLMDPGGLSSPKDAYGNEGGANPSGINTNILTIANPTNGIYTLAVKARVLGTAYPDASYTLRVRQVPAPELNFTAELNTNGLSNVGAGLLLDNQRAYYKVVVPTNVNGQPVLGWELNLSQSSGQAGLRVRKDALPSDLVVGMPFTANAAVLAPPFLTNGTWYVEVRGTNSTAYTLTSSALMLQRPAWRMPGAGEAVTTPGLTAPEFGDSGVDTNGVALPLDGGIDLERGRYHYYAIVVPTNNAGLLRVQLEAISGNPDFYLRTHLVPTASHMTNGLAGNTFERSLTSVVTEYGNFVPLDGKRETNLLAGTWYFAVRAVANANARYRLKVSTGTVQNLVLNGGSAASQILAAGDWRYYRVQIPAQSPTNWHVTFNQDAGDVVLYVRDTVPPGNGVSTNASEYTDWVSDAKNNGPYASYDLPGTYTFNVPPVRLDSVYYLGFRAKNDATFSLSSATSGASNALPPIIEFYGGSVTNVIPPNGQVAYRILTPGDGLRWRHSSIHSNGLQIYIENGTFPTKTSADDFRSTVPNSSLDRFLTTYPWLVNQTYYLIATNTTGLAQFFNFNMFGGNTTADDDADGMLDAWEIQYFGSLSQAPQGDFDVDGVSNLNEFLEGTNPDDNNSFRPRITLLVTNGVVNVNPASSNYNFGDEVTLTATPNAGYSFLDWRGHVSGTANPLVVTMNTNKTVIPRFRVPADDFDQRITIVGDSGTHSGLLNTGATKQPGEPNHAGNAGGKSLWWTWTAPSSGPATFNTAGSTFRNALAIYTGSVVSNLTVVATNLAGVGTNTSQVSFTAVSGTTYQIAVDGFNGANGTVVLNFSMPGTTILLSNPVRAGDGFFHFTITSPAGQVLRIDATTDFISWTAIATVTNVTGTMEFIDTNSPSFGRRFYRAVVAGAAVQSLMLSNPVRSVDGAFHFSVVGPTGQSLRVQAGTDLTNWTTLATVTNTSGTLPFTDSAATNFARRLYRVVAP